MGGSSLSLDGLSFVLDVKAEDLPRYSQSLHQHFVSDYASYSDLKVYELLFSEQTPGQRRKEINDEALKAP